MQPDEPAKKPADVGAAGEAGSDYEPGSSDAPLSRGESPPDEQAPRPDAEESGTRDQETTPADSTSKGRTGAGLPPAPQLSEARASGGDPTPPGRPKGQEEGTSEDQPATVYCVRCGNGMETGDPYCHGCGWEADRPLPSPAETTIPNPSRHSRLTAFLLCIVLGWVGAHRFYVGKIGTGILWLCTFGIFAVGTIYDAVLIGTGEFRDSDGRRVYRWQ